MQSKEWPEVKCLHPELPDDPVAEQTSWHVNMGLQKVNYCMNRFAEVSENRAEFRQNNTERHFCFFAMEAGVLIAGYAIFSFTSIDTKLFLAPLGLALALAGFIFYFLNDNKIVFDKVSGMFWIGKHLPDDAKEPSLVINDPDISVMKNYCRLEKIHAIQVVSEIDSANYLIYEMNLVLDDASRISLLKNVLGDKVKEDAAALAAFLNVPLWDASEKYPREGATNV